MGLVFHVDVINSGGYVRQILQAKYSRYSYIQLQSAFFITLSRVSD
jgi:hypothetical protein